MFGLGGSVTVFTDVMPHKLNALRAKQALLERKGKILCQADIKLALEVGNEIIKSGGPAKKYHQQ